MKKFEIKAIIKTAVLYDLAEMYHNDDNEFDDNNAILLLSTADEFSYVGTDESQYEAALDQYAYLSKYQKARIKEIENRILNNVNPSQMSTQEFIYLVNDFLSKQVAA